MFTEPLLAAVSTLRKLPTRSNTVMSVSSMHIVFPFEQMQSLLGQLKIDVEEVVDAATWNVCLTELCTHCSTVQNTGDRVLRSGITVIKQTETGLEFVSSSATSTITSEVRATVMSSWDNPLYGELELDASFSVPRQELLSLINHNSSMLISVERLIAKDGDELGRVRIDSGGAVMEALKTALGEDVGVLTEVGQCRVEPVGE